jgi:single-stranded DNA-binding protein
MFTTQIALEATLVANPVLRSSGQGTPHLMLRVADNRRVHNGTEWVDAVPSYHWVRADGKLAHNAARSLKRGDLAIIVGTLQTDTYLDNGESRRVTYVKASLIGPSPAYAVAVPEKVRNAAADTGAQPDLPPAQPAQAVRSAPSHPPPQRRLRQQ